MSTHKIGLCYITYNVEKSYELEWTARHLKKYFHLEWILLNPTQPYLMDYLQQEGIPVKWIPHYGKKSWFSTFRRLLSLLTRKRFSIVHSHLLDAVLLGLTAAKLRGIPIRIYTRHHASYHHTYFPRAVWYDRYANWIATGIVAISKNVRMILEEWERVPSSKIYEVNHGIDFEEASKVTQERILCLRKKYQLNGSPIIGVISRFIHLKGIQYVIPAFERLRRDYPNALLVLANATGNYEAQIRQQLNRLPFDSYRIIPFEYDVFALYKTFDLFVHVPIDPYIEAFGQTYIEAMALGVPMVCTLSGIAHELIVGGKNALVVPYKNSEAIYEAIQFLLKHPQIRDLLVTNAIMDVKRFSFQRKLDSLLSMYEDQLKRTL